MQRRARVALLRWSGGKPGYLVRAGARRAAVIARGEYSPRERGLYLDGRERMYVAAHGLDVPPDHELDMLQLNDRLYRIIEPVRGTRPDGTVMLYDCACLFDRVADGEVS